METQASSLFEEKAFFSWINGFAGRIGFEITNIDNDLSDGFFIAKLIELWTKSNLQGLHLRTSMGDGLSEQEKIDDNQRLIVGWVIDQVAPCDEEHLSRLRTAQFKNTTEVAVALLFLLQDFDSMSFERLENIFPGSQRLSGMLAAYGRVVGVFEHVLGSEHVLITKAKLRIADAHMEFGKPLDALPIIKSVLERFRKTPNSDNPETIKACELLGSIHLSTEKFDDAFECFSNAFEMHKKTRDDSDPSLATLHEKLAEVLFRLGRNKEALSHIESAFKIRKTTATKPTLKSTTLLEKLEELVRQDGRYDLTPYLRTVKASSCVEDIIRGCPKAWPTCENVHSLLMSEHLYNEAFDFWSHFVGNLAHKLGWSNPGVLRGCDYLSEISGKVGDQKEGIQFTNVAALIQENIPSAALAPSWNRFQVIALLFKIVHHSKTEEKKARAASTAITFLNYMGILFSRMDLSKVRIPNAYLGRAVIDGANFTDACLEGVDFTNAYLGDCTLNGANLKAARFESSEAVGPKKMPTPVGIAHFIPKYYGGVVLCVRTMDDILNIWDLDTMTQLYELPRNQFSYQENNFLLLKETPDNLNPKFSSREDAIFIIDSQGAGDSVLAYLAGPANLVGGNISVLNAKDMDKVSKSIIISLGAVTFDEDFVRYIEDGKYTNFQAAGMAECYRKGWVVEKNLKTSAEWFKMGGDFAGLRKIADEGSSEGFHVLREMIQKGSEAAIKELQTMSEMMRSILNRHRRKTGETERYPEAISLLAECYENGWMVEKDAKKAISLYLKSDKYDELKRLAQGGCKDAFDCLVESTGMVRTSHVRCLDRIIEYKKHPKSFAIVGECYEQGWGVEKNDEEALKYYRLVEDLADLKPALQQGLKVAFQALKEKAIAKVDHCSSPTSKICVTFAHPSAAPIILECYENGWGVEKNPEEIFYWGTLVPLRMSENYNELFKHAEQGSVHAFEFLKEISETLQSYATRGGGTCCTGRLKHPDASVVLSRCYEHGFGVEKNADESFYRGTLLLLKNNDDFAALKKYAEGGDLRAFHILEEKAQADTYENLQYPEAAAIVDELYEKGVAVERDLSKSTSFKYFLRDVAGLRKYAQEGFENAFQQLLKMAHLKEIVWGHTNSDPRPRYPLAVAAVAECYENGWGVEKNLDEAASWKALQN